MLNVYEYCVYRLTFLLFIVGIQQIVRSAQKLDKGVIIMIYIKNILSIKEGTYFDEIYNELSEKADELYEEKLKISAHLQVLHCV